MIVALAILAIALLAAVVFVCLITPRCDRRPGYLPMTDAELVRRVKKHTRPISKVRP